MQFNMSSNRCDCTSIAVLSGRFSLKYLADILFSILTLNTYKHWSAPIMVVIYCKTIFVVKAFVSTGYKGWKSLFSDDFCHSLRSFLSIVSCWDFLQLWSIKFGKASEYNVIFSLIFKGTLPERPVYVNLNAQCWKSFVHTTAY